MTDKPQEGPADGAVRLEYDDAVVYISVFGTVTGNYIDGVDLKEQTHELNKALAPLVQKAALADEMAKELRRLRDVVDDVDGESIDYVLLHYDFHKGKVTP